MEVKCRLVTSLPLAYEQTGVSQTECAMHQWNQSRTVVSLWPRRARRSDTLIEKSTKMIFLKCINSVGSNTQKLVF